MCFPRALARLLPSAVRVRIRSRSTSAKPPSTASISRPVLVPVSAHGSAKDRGKAMGRPPSLTPAQQKEATRRRAQGATLQELTDSYDRSIATMRRATREG